METPALRHPPIHFDPDKPPRCISCAYVLSGLGEEAVCPECGRGFNLLRAETYTTHRPFVGWRYWLSGVGAAVLLSVAIVLIDVYVIRTSGVSVWIVAPAVLGFACGYHVRLSVYPVVLLALIAFLLFILGIMSGGVAGVFCALVLIGIAMVPLVVGALLGHGLRTVFRRLGYDLRKPLVLGIAALLSLSAALLERMMSTPASLVTISTSGDINRPIDICFSSVQFYEEVRHKPPLILRIGLAHPLRTEGSSLRVGDRKTCIYNKGRLVKETTNVRAPELMEFNIIEQQIGYERDVRLTSGSFVLTPLTAESTRVTLTTTYQPLLGPRWAWAWSEAYAVHTLHSHVLEGMRRDAKSTGEAAASLIEHTAP